MIDYSRVSWRGVLREEWGVGEDLKGSCIHPFITG